MNLRIYLLFISMLINLHKFTFSEEIENRKSQSAPVVQDVIKNVKRLNRESNQNSFNEDISKLEQCAVMYKNQEPIGILQPYLDSYRLLPVNGEQIPVEISPVPVKKSIIDVIYPTQLDADDQLSAKNVDQLSQYADDRYPYIFAKFKIDSKVEKSLIHPRDTIEQPKPKLQKRDLSQFNQHLAEFQPETLDDELKSILIDMGLLDDDNTELIKEKEKREAEDENLEMGSNKINLVKAKSSKNSYLSKRENNDENEDQTDDSVDEVNGSKMEKHLPVDIYMKQILPMEPSEQKVNEEIERIRQESILNSRADAKKEAKTSNEDSEKNKEEKHEASHQNENSAALEVEEEEEHSRGKREKEEVSSTLTNNEEESVTTQESKQKRDDANQNRVSANDASTYEQELLRQIRSEINALKAQVKREITEESGASDFQVAEGTNQRRKRQVVLNTLLDEETRNLDPVLVHDERLIPRRRRKRNVMLEDATEFSVDVNASTDLLSSNSRKRDTSNNKRIKEIIMVATTMASYPLKSKDKQSYYSAINTQTSSEISKSKRQRRKRRFIGINPILKGFETIKTSVQQNISNPNASKINMSTTEQHALTNSDNSSIVKLRTLKQYDDDYSFINKDKEKVKPTPEKTKSQTRTKREASKINQEDANDLASCGGKEKKPNCHCSKSGEGCKCGIEKNEVSANNEYETYDEIDDNKKSAEESNDLEETENEDLERHERQISSNDPFSGKYKNRQTKSIPTFEDGEYYLDLYPAIYRISPIREFTSKLRKKRQNFDDLVALHGGATVLNHLAAVRRRSMLPIPEDRFLHNRFRRKVESSSNSNNPNEQQSLINMSDEDLFGALPQGYEGELARYKRVKRDKRNVKH